ncbi:MAG: TVP38/TMEM64 family protein [Syntrophaceae bacterium]|nr:TVP38/TMEM64 family protein [Syntrophaceae bacterium]
MNLYLGKKYIRICAGILLAGSLVWIYINYDFSKYLNIAEIRALIDSYGFYGPLIFIGFCIAGIFLHLPGIIIIALGGLLFGIVKGFIYGWIGVLIGVTGTFFCVRYILRDFFQKSLERRFHRLNAFDERLAEKGLVTILLLRLVLFLAPPLNWVIGLTRVKFRHYFAGSALGVIPGIAIACYFADSIAATKSRGTLLTGEMIVPAGLVAAMLIISGIAAWRLFRKRPIAPPRN